MQQKLRDLEIAHQCCAISRLHTGAVQSQDCVNLVRNLKMCTQFPDSENAQRNLKFVQIPRLRRTYALYGWHSSEWCMLLNNAHTPPVQVVVEDDPHYVVRRFESGRYAVDSEVRRIYQRALEVLEVGVVCVRVCVLGGGHVGVCTHMYKYTCVLVLF